MKIEYTRNIYSDLFFITLVILDTTTNLKSTIENIYTFDYI